MRVDIGQLTDFPDGHGLALPVAGRRLAVFRVGAALYALDDSCPHRGFPLRDGLVNGLTVRCRTHGSCFNLVSGAVERGPALRSVRIYQIEIVGDHVEVEIPG